jgi:alpha-D-ribose 1-methylphosphonate 5-triphosphate diphosphatase
VPGYPEQLQPPCHKKGHVPAIDPASAASAARGGGRHIDDRGEIAISKRADLIRVHVAGDSVWREGHRVA